MAVTVKDKGKLAVRYKPIWSVKQTCVEQPKQVDRLTLITHVIWINDVYGM